MIREEEILHKAAQAFIRQTGLRLEWSVRGNEPGLFADASVTLQAPGRELRFLAEIKARVTAVDALLPLVQKTNRPQDVLLVTRLATEEAAERLRENGIQFIDEAGNAFINHPPFYIFIKGNRNLEAAKPPPIGRAFKQTGLKILYVLLCNPGLEGQPYRTIAAKAGVALGMVNWVMGELKELGFLVEVGKGRGGRKHLAQKERLLERWITAYAEQLRPKLLHGRYRGAAGWWQNANLKTEKALWGGEVATAKLTGFLKPQEITIYIDQNDPAAVLIPFKLKKDPQGEVELLYRFWQPEAILPNADMVHPLLVYADLMATGNQRNLEAARMIHDRHIVQLVREA